MPFKDIEERREAQRRWYKKNKDAHNDARSKARVTIRLKKKEKLNQLLKSHEINNIQPKKAWLKAGRAVPVFTVDQTLKAVGVSRPTLLRWEEASLLPPRTFGNGYTHHQVQLIAVLAAEIKRNTKGRSGLDRHAIQSTMDRAYASWTTISEYPTMSEALPE